MLIIFMGKYKYPLVLALAAVQVAAGQGMLRISSSDPDSDDWSWTPGNLQQLQVITHALCGLTRRLPSWKNLTNYGGMS